MRRTHDWRRGHRRRWPGARRRGRRSLGRVARRARPSDPSGTSRKRTMVLAVDPDRSHEETFDGEWATGRTSSTWSPTAGPRPPPSASTRATESPPGPTPAPLMGRRSAASGTSANASTGRLAARVRRRRRPRGRRDRKTRPGSGRRSRPTFPSRPRGPEVRAGYLNGHGFGTRTSGPSARQSAYASAGLSVSFDTDASYLAAVSLTV